MNEQNPPRILIKISLNIIIKRNTWLYISIILFHIYLHGSIILLKKLRSYYIFFIISHIISIYTQRRYIIRSNATYHPFVLILSPKIDVPLKIVIEFIIDHY
jgi:hypothetical protein